MDSPAGLSFQANRLANMNQLVDLRKGMLESEKKCLSLTHEYNLEQMKAALPEDLYRNVLLPMADKSFKYEIQTLEANHKQQIEKIEKDYMGGSSRHQPTSHDQLELNIPTNDTLHDQGEIIDDEEFAATHFTSPTLSKDIGVTAGDTSKFLDSKKRKASLPGDNTKRLRLDTAINPNPLCTPATTPLVEFAPQRFESTPQKVESAPQRFVAFNEVYQDGKADHKDTIVEWPAGSHKWYILKCGKHNLRFKSNPVTGAATHLNGSHHGFPDRNRDTAVKTLGYQVVDCNEALAELNNKLAEESYGTGHKSPSSKTTRRLSTTHNKQQESTSNAPVILPTAPEVAVTSQGPTQETATSRNAPRDSKSADPGNPIILNPKDFHIYYGRWKLTADGGENLIYPVMILGWDAQDGSGLECGTTLKDTGLLEKSSRPPGCYVYGDNKIISWKPEYANGGPRVKFRRFPVMFFDESQTVAWLPAEDLERFPLYKTDAPSDPSDPFNAARRWIAEREGFKTWDDRERNRMNVLLTGHYGNDGAHGPAEGTGVSGNNNDSVDSDLESEARSSTSNGTTETEKLLREMMDKGGEIEGDEDYEISDADVDGKVINEANDVDDNVLDLEPHDWDNDPSVIAEAKADFESYPLRSTKTSGQSASQANPTSETREAGEAGLADAADATDATVPAGPSGSAGSAGSSGPAVLAGLTGPAGPSDPADSVAMGMKSARKLSHQACSTSSTSSVPNVLSNKSTLSMNQPPMTPGLSQPPQLSQPSGFGIAFKSTEAESRDDSQKGVANIASMSVPSTANADFELITYHNDDHNQHWTKSDGERGVQLFYSPDKKSLRGRGPMGNVTIDPCKYTSFSRMHAAELSDRHRLVLLVHEDGSVVNLAFSRSEGSPLGSGMVQSRRFAQWIRQVNPAIQYKLDV
ncbi:uncharacterized protein F4822DRAFT_430901 [Hypoxylon trugodes]|uniref:uncharacterized protein n=1 Tax=Hypoxylon trugodes TaxID=326681 RepID=UPI00219C56A5|nr:uncharacterized protein F4822DRAFT_430901 [Hypoxylon trugodes]KAI1388146.1 hypothetical protein F4822DRAFT_430901 [Hypoxylon trugodes]